LYLVLKEKGEFRFKNFVQNLETDPKHNEKMALYEDILSENREALRLIFPKTGRDDVADLAIVELRNLPFGFIGEDFGYFESILQRAINGTYDGQNDTVVRNLYLLYTHKSSCLSYPRVLSLIKNRQVSERYQIMFIRALSESEDDTKFDWDEIISKDNNVAIPGYLYHYHKTDPAKSLTSLKLVQTKFANEYKDFFYHGIEESLRHFMKKYKLALFSKIKKSIKSEVILEVIDEIINLEPEFATFFSSASQDTQFKEWTDEYKKTDFFTEVSKYILNYGKKV